MLALRRTIFASFAATGAPPGHIEDTDALRALAERHIVALDAKDGIVMAHPFAAHREGTRVEANDREWWGNCAWDGLGITAALGLEQARITDTRTGVSLELHKGELTDPTPVFHVAVPAAHWWDDIGHT
jgi:hypothetical protein